MRNFEGPVHQNESAAPIEGWSAGHSGLHLILLRAMAGVLRAVGMAGRRVILARLHNATRKTPRVGKHQHDSEQDQNFTRKPKHVSLG